MTTTDHAAPERLLVRGEVRGLVCEHEAQLVSVRDAVELACGGVRYDAAWRVRRSLARLTHHRATASE
jgi:hypothetical protein